MKNQLKPYLIGFSKGLGLFILLQLVRGLYHYLLGLNTQAIFVTPGDLLVWLIGFVSVIYLVTLSHFPIKSFRSWALENKSQHLSPKTSLKLNS
ncbi:MAG TPA: hypothetical protein VF209_03095 [Patescibacteria group bacterium]